MLPVVLPSPPPLPPLLLLLLLLLLLPPPLEDIASEDEDEPGAGVEEDEEGRGEALGWGSSSQLDALERGRSTPSGPEVLVLIGLSSQSHDGSSGGGGGGGGTWRSPLRPFPEDGLDVPFAAPLRGDEDEEDEEDEEEEESPGAAASPADVPPTPSATTIIHPRPDTTSAKPSSAETSKKKTQS